jgi:hypothetical protein
VPNLRTMVTEVGTGLGMLGLDSVDDVLSARPGVMRSLSPEDWDRLLAARAGGALDAEFHAAWENGRSFLAARDGLRGRLPDAVEWKGAIRAAGDEVAPVDLRIDHVYLVSCKYLSNILFNVAPAHVFDALLTGGQGRSRVIGDGRGSGDWYADTAPVQFQELYSIVRRSLQRGDAVDRHATPLPSGRVGSLSRHGRPSGGPSLPGMEAEELPSQHMASSDVVPSDPLLRDLPEKATEMSTSQRTALGSCLKVGWPPDAKAVYGELATEVSQHSALRWQAALTQSPGSREAMLWRLLRMGSAPYFVLGTSATRSIRLRIATPWDWRQQFALGQFEVFAQEGGQPRVGWHAGIRDRHSGETHEISGHIEIRWSHGRFGGPPEAKGYLDTPHHLVPGYFPLQ